MKSSQLDSQKMSSPEDSVIAKALLDRKLVTPDELQSCQSEVRQRQGNGESISLGKVVVQHGFATESQISRLSEDSKDDSMYKPAQQIPGFQVMARIGQGAMATVFKAKQLSLDRTVAVKVLPRRMSENTEFVNRFYKEGKAAAKLNHVNIVQAIDVGEAGG